MSGSYQAGNNPIIDYRNVTGGLVSPPIKPRTG